MSEPQPAAPASSTRPTRAASSASAPARFASALKRIHEAFLPQPLLFDAADEPDDERALDLADAPSVAALELSYDALQSAANRTALVLRSSPFDAGAFAPCSALHVLSLVDAPVDFIVALPQTLTALTLTRQRLGNFPAVLHFAELCRLSLVGTKSTALLAPPHTVPSATVIPGHVARHPLFPNSWFLLVFSPSPSETRGNVVSGRAVSKTNGRQVLNLLFGARRIENSLFIKLSRPLLTIKWKIDGF